MRLMKKGNIIYRFGLLLIIVGIILPGSAGAVVPTVCQGNVTDLTDQENTFVEGTYTANPVICYSFTVGADPKLLAVNLKYDPAGGNLDMYLFDSSGGDALQNSTKVDSQGDETLFVDPASAQETYYVRINGMPSMNGYAYQFKWLDQDNTGDFPTVIEGSENPADGASVAAGTSGQLLQVEVGNATGCTFHYGVDTSTTASVAGTLNGTYCEATVPYGADMTDNGTNYWYVEAVNAAGTIRYPDAPATLSFTVSTIPDKKPVIITPVLMLLLNKKQKSVSTSGKAMPWLMLLLLSR
jgi:hypothetical protein